MIPVVFAHKTQKIKLGCIAMSSEDSRICTWLRASHPPPPARHRAFIRGTMHLWSALLFHLLASSSHSSLCTVSLSCYLSASPFTASGRGFSPACGFDFVASIPLLHLCR